MNRSLILRADYYRPFRDVAHIANSNNAFFSWGMNICERRNAEILGHRRGYVLMQKNEL